MLVKNSYKPGDVVEFQVKPPTNKYLIFFIFVVAFFYASHVDKEIAACESEDITTEIQEQEFSDYQLILWFLKKEESLIYSPIWDVNDWRNGWGTTAKHKTERITLQEANKRTKEVFDSRYKTIDKRYPSLDRWTKLVVAAFHYNVYNIGEGLDKSLKAGDKEKIASYMVQYVNDSKGNFRQGLKDRRVEEVKLLKAMPQEKQYLAKLYKNKVLQKIKNAKS